MVDSIFHVYIYVTIQRDYLDVLEIQAAQPTLIFHSIVIRLRPSLKEYYACCKLQNNGDNTKHG